MKRLLARRDRGPLPYRLGGGTYIVLELLRRRKGKVVTGIEIEEELSKHGKSRNYHAIQRLILDGWAIKHSRGQYSLDPNKQETKRRKKATPKRRNRASPKTKGG